MGCGKPSRIVPDPPPVQAAPAPTGQSDSPVYVTQPKPVARPLPDPPEQKTTPSPAPAPPPPPVPPSTPPPLPPPSRSSNRTSSPLPPGNNKPLSLQNSIRIVKKDDDEDDEDGGNGSKRSRYGPGRFGSTNHVDDEEREAAARKRREELMTRRHTYQFVDQKKDAEDIGGGFGGLLTLGDEKLAADSDDALSMMTSTTAFGGMGGTGGSGSYRGRGVSGSSGPGGRNGGSGGVGGIDEVPMPALNKEIQPPRMHHLDLDLDLEGVEVAPLNFEKKGQQTKPGVAMALAALATPTTTTSTLSFHSDEQPVGYTPRQPFTRPLTRSLTNSSNNGGGGGGGGGVGVNRSMSQKRRSLNGPPTSGTTLVSNNMPLMPQPAAVRGARPRSVVMYVNGNNQGSGGGNTAIGRQESVSDRSSSGGAGAGVRRMTTSGAPGGGGYQLLQLQHDYQKQFATSDPGVDVGGGGAGRELGGGVGGGGGGGSLGAAGSRIPRPRLNDSTKSAIATSTVEGTTMAAARPVSYVRPRQYYGTGTPAGVARYGQSYSGSGSSSSGRESRVLGQGPSAERGFGIKGGGDMFEKMGRRGSEVGDGGCGGGGGRGNGAEARVARRNTVGADVGGGGVGRGGGSRNGGPEVVVGGPGRRNLT